MTIGNQLPRTSIFDISVRYNCSKVAINLKKKKKSNGFSCPKNLTNEVVFSCKHWRNQHSSICDAETGLLTWIFLFFSRLLLNLQTSTFENFSVSSWSHSPSSTGEVLSNKKLPISTTTRLSLKSPWTSENWRDALQLPRGHRWLLLPAVRWGSSVAWVARISCIFFSSWGFRVLKWEQLLPDIYLLLDWKEKVSFLFCFQFKIKDRVFWVEFGFEICSISEWKTNQNKTQRRTIRCAWFHQITVI